MIMKTQDAGRDNNNGVIYDLFINGNKVVSGEPYAKVVKVAHQQRLSPSDTVEHYSESGELYGKSSFSEWSKGHKKDNYFELL
jgi:hypothetical protein